ncbi:MAG: hypothetical protein MRZ79_13915 [Bacteroidia bacterium]|nr:hypothetical protein [Bacteroidia bacterium]
MKTKLFFLILICGALAGYSQDLLGKWYRIGRGSLQQLEITPDSIFSKRLWFDFSPIYHVDSVEEKGESNAYHSIKKIDNRYLIIFSKDKSSKFDSEVLFDFQKSKWIKLAWNYKDSVFSDLENTISFYSNDRKKLFGYTLFHENYIPTLQSMKSIKKMDKEEFKRFLNIYFEKIDESIKEFDKFNSGYIAILYNSEQITQALYEAGYNPLERMDELEELFIKFKDEPEIKALIDSRDN